MKLIDRFVSRELLVNVLFAIVVLSLVLVVGNIFRKLLPLLVNHDVPMEYLLARAGLRPQQAALEIDCRSSGHRVRLCCHHGLRRRLPVCSRETP